MTWHELYTPIAKKACAFYGGLLNATVERMPGGMEYYTLHHGAAPIAGIMQIDPAWGPMQAMWVNYWQVTHV